MGAIQYAKIAATTSGNTTVVAAQSGKRIRVLAYNLISAGSVVVKFQSGAGGTDLTGAKTLVESSGIVCPQGPDGWFQTEPGDLLNINLSASVTVGGEMVYEVL